MSVLFERVQKFANGISILKDWLGEGAVTVSQELAQARTDVCLSCPLNQDGGTLVESVAKTIKAQVRLKNHLGMRTNGIKSLKTCRVCSCYLPLKIFLPIERIRPTTEDKFPAHCWIMKETNQTT